MTDWGFYFLSSLTPGQCDAAYQDPNPPGETTTQNTTETQVKTHEKNICYTACPTQFSKTPVSSNNTSQRATPKSWCASDSVQIRGLDVGGDWGPKPLQGLSRRGVTSGSQFSHWSPHPLPEPLCLFRWSCMEPALPWGIQSPHMTRCPLALEEMKDYCSYGHRKMVIPHYAHRALSLTTKVYQPSHFIINFDPVSWAQQVLSPSLPTFYRRLKWFAQGLMTQFFN